MTAAYLARVIETKEIVGFFVVERFDDLMDVIDEVCDPGSCEVIKLSSPGGLFISNDAPSIPMPPDLDPEGEESTPEQQEWEEKLFSHSWSTSERWSDPLFEQSKRWRLVCAP